MKPLAGLIPALLLLLGAAPRAEFRLEAALPDSTLLFAEIPSAATFREAFKKTRLHRFFQDEEIRAFFEEAFEASLQDLDGFRRELEAETGIALDRAWELADGQVALALTSLEPPTALLTVECPGKRDVLLKLAAYARKAHDARSDVKAETWRMGDAEALSGRLPGGVPLNVVVLGDVLALATTREALEALEAGRRQPPARPLGSSAVFLKAREKAGAKDAFFYADVAGFVKAVQENLGPQERRAVAALGLGGFTFAAAGVDLGETHVTERAFLGAGPERKGLAKFLSLKGAAPGFEAAPADALQFLSLSIDVAELYDTVLEIAQEADPPAAARLRDTLADFEQEAGITLKGDLFPALGHRISSYSALPQDGLLPDGVSLFEIRDAARFDACLDAALRNLGATLGAVPFRGASIRFFRFQDPPLDDPARLLLSSLYFLREDDRLIVSAPLLGGLGGVNAVKRHVLRRDRPRLAAAPAVRDWLGGRTGDASLVYYLDLERGFTALYNTVAPFALFFGEGLRDTGLDLLKLPLGETIGKYLSQIVHRVRVEPDGLSIEGTSASGTSLMTATYGGAAALVLGPAISRAGERRKTSACLSGLTSLFFALNQYRADKEAWPKGEGLDALKPLKEQGYLDDLPSCPHVGSPAWRGPAKPIDGLQDADVIFCDDPANHPDGSINILRKDGSLETLKKNHPDYKKALETTR